MRNSENHLIQSTSFIGIERNVDPFTLPTGKFLDGHDMISSDVMGEVRTRDGYAPVVDSIYPSAFKIMGGARGRLWTPPWLRLPPIEVVDEEFALKISYSPNSELYVNSIKPVQPVTFFVYGGEELGITGNYTWDFGDGGTSVGTALSVNHNYTNSGTYRVTVSGGGYSASTIIKIDTRAVPVDPGTPGVPGVPGAPGTPGTGDKDGNSPLSNPTIDIKVNGSDGPVDIAVVGNVTVTWISRNADYVEIDGEVKPSSGSMTKAIPAYGRIIYADAFGGGQVATDVVTVTVDGSVNDTIPADRMDINVDMPVEVFSGDPVVATYSLAAKIESGDKQLYPVNYTGYLSALHVDKGKMKSDGAGGIYKESILLTDQSSIANVNTIQFDLAEGVEEAVATVKAYLTNNINIVTERTVKVVRKAFDFEITVIGATTDPAEFDGVESYVTSFNLNLKVKFAGTDIIATGFAENVQLSAEVTDYASAGNDVEMLTMTGCQAVAVPDGVSISYETPFWVIPAAVWAEGDGGQCSLSMTAQLPVDINSWPAMQSYQDIQFSAEVKI